MTKLYVLFVIAFIDMVGLAIILPLLPYYATDFGANAVVVGLLVSAFSVAQLASAPAWGRLSDRYGRRPAILAGLAITTAAYVAFAMAHTVELLLLSRLVQGLGGGTIGVVQAYVADASAPEQRTRSLGWLTAVTSLGAVVGPAFGSAMVAVGGRPAPGVGAAALTALVAAFAWRYLRESRTERRSSQISAEQITPRGALSRVLVHWRDPVSRLVWLYAVAIGAFYGTAPIMPLLLVERLRITESTIGYVIMYLGAIGVVVRAVLLGPAVDRLGEPRLARIGIVALALGLSVLSMAHSFPILFVSLTLMPIGTGLLFPCVTSLLSRAVPSRDRGLYMGVQHTFGGVSRVMFPIGAGLMMDQMGLGAPFVTAGILVLVTLPLTYHLLAGREPKDGPPARPSWSDPGVGGEFPIPEATASGDTEPGRPS